MKVVCPHGNMVSIGPSFNYARCAKCDADATPTTPANSAEAANIPRRACIDKLTPIETQARSMMISIEAQGAHPLLTDAVTALAAARNSLADWIDAGKPGAIQP